MANTISRANPGDLAAGTGTTFRTNLNTDRAILYAHLVAIETMLELICSAIFGKGTISVNTAVLTIDDPVAGRVYCPANYMAIIGGAAVKTTATIYQSYTPSVLNHVFLVVATDGTLTLRCSTSATEAANELWIADVTAVPAIDNEPTGKAYVEGLTTV